MTLRPAARRDLAPKKGQGHVDEWHMNEILVEKIFNEWSGQPRPVEPFPCTLYISLVVLYTQNKKRGIHMALPAMARAGEDNMITHEEFRTHLRYKGATASFCTVILGIFHILVDENGVRKMTLRPPRRLIKFRSSETKLRRLLRVIDPNQSGSLDLHEWKAFFKMNSGELSQRR
jgi:hypothetical protein